MFFPSPFSQAAALAIGLVFACAPSSSAHSFKIARALAPAPASLILHAPEQTFDPSKHLLIPTQSPAVLLDQHPPSALAYRECFERGIEQGRSDAVNAVCASAHAAAKKEIDYNPYTVQPLSPVLAVQPVDVKADQTMPSKTSTATKPGDDECEVVTSGYSRGYIAAFNEELSMHQKDLFVSCFADASRGRANPSASAGASARARRMRSAAAAEHADQW